MDIFSTVDSVALSKEMAGGLQVLNITYPEAELEALVNRLGGGPVRSAVMQGGGKPKVWIGQGPNITVVLAQCLQSPGQGTALWNGYESYYFQSGNTTENYWLRTWAESVQAFMGANRFTTPRSLLLVGHSAGGAMLHYFGQVYKETIAGLPVRIITFGSPKAGGSVLANAQSEGTVTRWMNDGDPVPDVPPPLAGLSSWGLIYSALIVQRLGKFVHSHGGVALAVDGTFVDRTLPRITPLNWPIAVGAAVFSYTVSSDGPHSIAEYYRRLSLAVAASPVADPQTGGGGDYGGGFDESTPAIQALLVQAQQNVFAREVGRAINDIVVPLDAEFRYRREGRIWSLYFAGDFVAIGPSKKRARAMARIGNEFLRRLQTGGVVDTGQFIQTFQQYLTRAADPLGGFNPPLNALVP